MKRTLLFILLIFCGGYLYSDIPDYLEFVGGQVRTIRCILCGRAIAATSEVPSVKYPGKTFEKLKIFPNYRNRKVTLEDGSYTVVPLCRDCDKKDTESNADRMEEQIRRGFELQAISSGQSPEDIEKVKDKYKDLKIKEDK